MLLVRNNLCNVKKVYCSQEQMSNMTKKNKSYEKHGWMKYKKQHSIKHQLHCNPSTLFVYRSPFEIKKFFQSAKLTRLTINNHSNFIFLSK